MFGASHIPQTITIKNPTPRRFMTGAEMRYGKGTFSKSFEKNSEVLAVFELYNTTKQGEGSISQSPESIVIFEDDETGTVGCMSLTDFCSHHPTYGFYWKNSHRGQQLRKGIMPGNRSFGEGEVLQGSPNVMADGNYNYGLEANVVFLTMAGTAEDGIIISKSFAKKTGYSQIMRVRVGYGTTHFPLNTYGTDEKVKLYPDIGEYVNDSGILFASRPWDSDTRVVAGNQRFLKDKIFDATFAPIDMSRKALREVSHLFDNITFVPPGGKVLSIKVTHDKSQTMKTPPMLNEQPMKYDAAKRKCYKQIYDFYKDLERKRKTRLRMSDEFALLIKDCISVLNEDRETQIMKTENVQKTYKTVALDDVTVEFIIGYETEPVIGGKGSDCHGGKGVFIDIRPDEDMPTDEWGNRADVVFDPYSVIGRMNLGRFYEQYFNCVRRDLTRDLHDVVGIPYTGCDWKQISTFQAMQVKQMVETGSNPALQNWIQRYLRFTTIMRPEQGAWLQDYASRPKDFGKHIVHVLQTGIYINFPSDNSVELPDVVDAILAEFPPRRSQVRFRGVTGKWRTSKTKALIGSMYFILLDKSGSDWTAVSSARLQNNGVISQVTNADKNSSPMKVKSIRFLGETEYRIVMAYIGAINAAELHDRNNSIASHTFAVNNLFSAPYPTNIEVLVDRTQIPLGKARPTVMIKHYGYCCGWNFEYRRYEENAQPVNVVFDNE